VPPERKKDMFSERRDPAAEAPIKNVIFMTHVSTFIAKLSSQVTPRDTHE
jgi:hypothetical protein